MKKLIIAFALFMAAAFAHATTTIPIVWGFSPASNQANALRVIIDNANKAQDKYLFVFENKQGAGGSIAANQVIRSEKPQLLMISTSVLTRPYYFPSDSHDPNDLEPVAVVATGSPLVIISKKYKTLKELQDSKASIGTGIGSMAEAVARTASGGSLNLIPYKSNNDSLKDALGGHVDSAIDQLSATTGLVEDGKINAIAITGTRKISPFKTLLPGGEKLVMNYQVLTSKRVPKEMVEELNAIIRAANNQPNTKAIWEADTAEVQDMDLAHVRAFWARQKQLWSK